MSYVLSGLITFAMIALAVFTKRQEGRWLAPGVFFSLLWAIYVAVSLFFVSNPESHLPGLMWILLSCGCVCAGANFARAMLLRTMIARGTLRQPRSSTTADSASTSQIPTRTIRLPALRTITLVLVLLGLGEIVYIFGQRGVSIQDAFSLTAMAQVSSANRVEFTYGDRRQSQLEWVVFVLVYASTLFGGAYCRLAPNRAGQVLGIMTVMNSAVFGTLYGSRMGVLFGGSFWIAAFLAAHVLVVGRSRKSDLIFLLRIWGYSGAILLGFSVATMAIRYRFLDAPRAVERHLAETFVFVPAFCEWFRAEGLTDRERLWGFRTFWKAYELMGVIEDPELPIPVEQTSSNIFTVYRGLIDDFGPFGSCMALFAFGIMASASYLAVQNGRASFMPLLIFSYAYTFLSTSFSLFTYNAPNVAMLIFALYFVVRRIGAKPGIELSSATVLAQP